MSRSALSLMQVSAAKRDHNRNCPWRKPGIEVHIHPDGIEELGWEEGDMIAGLKVVADAEVPRQRLRVYCEGDLGEPEHEELEHGTIEGVRGVPVPA